jgi:glycosyltransferase involved in cell wall biosynthesis
MDFTCQIIGTGPYRAELEALIHKYQLSQVRLLGPQPQPIVIEHFKQADVFVLASVVSQKGERDGMPVSLSEAMAMELPVISTDLVGIGEMVRPEAGLLVPPNNAQALAEAIQHIYRAGKESRTVMGKNGRRIIAEGFDLQKGVCQLASLICCSIEERRGHKDPAP